MYVWKVENQFSSVTQLCPTPWTPCLRPHGLQHTRPPCPSSTPRAWLNSGPSSRWCHPTILASVFHFSSCFQASVFPFSFCLLPTSGSFPRSQFFASGDQCIGVSTSASVLPSNEYSRLISFRIDWLDLLANQETLNTVKKHQFFSSHLSFFFFFFHLSL